MGFLAPPEQQAVPAAASALARALHKSDPGVPVLPGTGAAANRYRSTQERRACNMRHIISLLLENESGALSRVSGLFSARGYNIESLTVAPTEDSTLSRMTIVTSGSDDVIEQITKQLNKLVDVVKVVDLSDGEHIEREMMLVKVRAAGKDREEMKRMAEIFRGRIIDVTDKSYTIELTGPGTKLDAFLNALERGSILETVRTGASGIGRGERVLKV
jgi:acetolactate synthase I/III small subunit